MTSPGVRHYTKMTLKNGLLFFGPIEIDGISYQCSALNDKEIPTLTSNNRTIIYVCKADLAQHTLDLGVSGLEITEDSSYNSSYGRYAGRLDIYNEYDINGDYNPINIFRDLEDGLFIGDLDTKLRCNTFRLDSSGNVKIDINSENVYAHAFNIQPAMTTDPSIYVSGSDISIGDVLIFNEYLPDSECRRVEAYLMDKFGIS